MKKVLKKSVVNKFAAGAMLAATVSIGSAGIAGAAEDAPSRPAPTTEQRCERARVVLHRVDVVDDRLHSQYRKLLELKARAEAAGKTDAVARIDARLAQLRERHARLQEHVQNIHDRVAEACNLPEPTPDELS